MNIFDGCTIKIIGKWSKDKMPCEEIHSRWVSEKEQIMRVLTECAEQKANEVYEIIKKDIPDNEKERVRGVISRFYNRCAEKWYDYKERHYDFQIWQKEDTLKSINSAKTEDEKEYYESIYTSLY